MKEITLIFFLAFFMALGLIIFIGIPIYHYGNKDKWDRLEDEGIKSIASVTSLVGGKSGPSISYYFYIHKTKIESGDTFVKGKDGVLQFKNKVWIIYLPSDPEISKILRDSAENPLLWDSPDIK